MSISRDLALSPIKGANFPYFMEYKKSAAGIIFQAFCIFWYLLF